MICNQSVTCDVAGCYKDNLIPYKKGVEIMFKNKRTILIFLAIFFLGFYQFSYAAPLLSSPAWTYESNQVSAYIGTSVATAGDVNGDGYDDVIIGAPFYGTGGAAFVFHGSASGLSATPNWIGTGDKSGIMFGYSVASGDVNGDGNSDVIVGAPSWYETYPTLLRGNIFVYFGSSAGLSTTPNWTSVDFVTNINTLSRVYRSSFGYSVASGDVNGDGIDDIIVGAPYYDHDGIENSYSRSGGVLVWYGSHSGFSTYPNNIFMSLEIDSMVGWTVDTMKTTPQ